MNPDNTRILDDVHVDAYCLRGAVVTAVFWKGAEPAPFLTVKRGPVGEFRRFALLENSDVAPHDEHRCHLNVTATMEMAGETVRAISVVGAGGAPIPRLESPLTIASEPPCAANTARKVSSPGLGL